MPKVLCTLPNASEEINGVKFVTHAAGMLSEEIADDLAKVFASIPGYKIVGAKDPDEEADEKAAAEAAKAALLARAAAIDLKVKANWSTERLASEVDGAEKAAAEAAVEAK